MLEYLVQKTVGRARSSRVKVARKKVATSVTQAETVLEPQLPAQTSEVDAERIASALQSEVNIVEQQVEQERRDAIFFDGQWYLNAYPDIREEGINPLEHFLAFGAKEGRNPNALFDSAAYLRINPDVAAFEYGPFIHYVSYGFKEGRPLR